MAKLKVTVPGFGENDGEPPIVILGPNGSGKTRLAQKIATSNQVSAISAQRRTWIDDSLPVQEESSLRNQIRSHQDRWRAHAYQATEEINFILSSLIQDHTTLLSRRNEEAIAAGKAVSPVTNSKLILLQGLWGKLYPKRKLEIGGFFPKVTRLDVPSPSAPYLLRDLSDGERTVLYMAARVLTAEQSIILIDEPELHMHSRLAVHFWDEAQRLRPDCRFIYITHDLNFALSRRIAEVLVTRADEKLEVIPVNDIPSSVAADVLGAATLPFYAKRIFFYEGEAGKGFASELFSAWFDDPATFAIPSGDRDAVFASVAGLQAVGVAGAEIIGLVDRDFYPDCVLKAVPKGVQVLALHEIESILCAETVFAILAGHLGKDSGVVWKEFLNQVRKVFRGKTLSNVVAQRVRARIGDLLDGAFGSSQIDADVKVTSGSHKSSLIGLDLPNRVEDIFEEELKRTEAAIAAGNQEMLAILPGKHLLSIASGVLGFSNQSEMTALVVEALGSRHLAPESPLSSLVSKLQAALLAFLPVRHV